MADDFLAAAALATALLLVACEPRPEWVKEGVSAEENQNNLSYCNGSAELAKYYSMNHPSASDIIITNAFESCMRKKGYRPETRQQS